MSKPAHRRGGPGSYPPAALPPLRTVRDEPSLVAPSPEPEANDTSDLAFTEDTSLLTLFEAILGAPPGRVRDHSAQVRIVDAQIRALREELGLPEPPPPPAAVISAPESAPVSAAQGDPGDEPVLPPHERRRTGWREVIAGLAGRRKPHVEGALAIVAGMLW